jgi:hypothetical protein
MEDKKMKHSLLKTFLKLALFIPWILTSCSLTGNSGSLSQVWLDVPLNDLHFPVGQAINIEGHATSSGQDAAVELWINTVKVTSLDLSTVKDQLSYFTYSYNPPGPGEYTIQVVLIGTADSETPMDSVHIVVGDRPAEEIPATATPTRTSTADNTITPDMTHTPSVTLTYTPTPLTSVEFWADPLPVQAGGCTTLYWEVENAARVVFGGVDMSPTGSYQVCGICETQNYRLTVTYPDDHEETVWVEITITGSCATPTPTKTVTPTIPPPDSTPPPVPSPSVPANGLSLSCRSSQAISWLPVTDPSGIAEYRVEVQRSSDNSTWNATSYSPITGINDKTTTLSTDCGWYYRWRVQALDGAGNISSWSVWSYFSITLE